MFSSAPNYNKLKTNLRLACNRLKLLEKKKTETNQKARKEIAGNISHLFVFHSVVHNLIISVLYYPQIL